MQIHPNEIDIAHLHNPTTTFDLATPWSARIANNEVSRISRRWANCKTVLSIADERGHKQSASSFEKRERERDVRVHKQAQVATKIVMKSVCRTWAATLARAAHEFDPQF